MEELKKENADKIIKNHMIWSMGAGLLPVPLADFFAVSAIQLDMIRQLSKLHKINFSENETKAIISALSSSVIAKLGARAAIKLIPGFGTIVGGVTMSIISGASTYAVGETFKKHFESGGTILDFDIDQLKKVFDSKFEKGKKYAKDLKKDVKDLKQDVKENLEDNTFNGHSNDTDDQSKSASDPISNLKSLVQLKKDGIITDEEFEKMKKKII